MTGISDEQRPHHYMNADGHCHAGDMFEAGTPFVALYTADVVDTLRERLATAGDLGTEYANDYADAIERAELAETALRDMEIERNMLRICVKELTDSLEAGDACGAVRCRAMERLAKVEALADEWQSDRISLRGLGFRALEYGDEFAADLRAALSTERGEGRE